MCCGVQGWRSDGVALFEKHSLSKSSCEKIDGWTICYCEDDSTCNLKVSRFAERAGVGNLTKKSYHMDGCLTKTHFWLIVLAVVLLFVGLIAFCFSCWWGCFLCGFRKGRQAERRAHSSTSLSLEEG